MDNGELKSLIKEAVLEILQELKEDNTEPKTKKVVKKATRTPVKKTPTKKAVTKRTKVSKTKDHNKAKLKTEPWRKTFVDNLEDEVFIETPDGPVSLIEIDKKIAQKRPTKQKKIRTNSGPVMKKCQNCQREFDGSGGSYLCNSCITGR